MQHALAIDLGGTKVEAALVDARGTIVPGSRHRASTGASVEPSGLHEAIATIGALAIEKLPEGGSILGAGIASAGPLDARAGTIAPLNMPSLHGTNLRALVSAATGLDVVALGHDGACFALAESRFGAAAGRADCIAMVVSTGIGGGLIIDGRLVSGSQGNAGHIGQLRVESLLGDAPARQGTLEDHASGPASVNWAQQHGWRGADGVALAAAARNGDLVARQAIERSAAVVGAALAGLAALLDTREAIIGGGFSRAADDYHELAERAARDAAVLPAAIALSVRRPALGDDAPLIGAACLLLD